MDPKILEAIKKEASLELARRDFYHFCKLMMPSFYKDNRKYLKYMCNEMQEFYEQDDEVLVINVPPRHAKSLTASMFTKWLFGRNTNEKVMTASYNEMLSTMFSKGVRNDIMAVKADDSITVYSDIFPNTKIKQGDAAMNLWSLEGGYNNYLATSPGGTATGFGASIIIVDDLIKNADEAFNDMVLEKHWEWFTNTMLSRLEEGGKIIIIMTRWSSKDLAGRALKHFGEEGKKMRHINLKAMQDDGSMLCDEVLSKRSYLSKTRAMSPEIAAANYQQEPIDVKGRLYSSFKTYTPGDLPKFKEIRNYTDTADTGADFLCSINYGVTMDNEAYVLDVLFTDQSMEVTEPLNAEMLYERGVNVATIESNNGGRGYARSVENILRAKYRSNKTVFKTFHQTKNKKARILSNSTWVMEHIYFPENWRDKWTDFHESLTTYQKNGKNKHDDAADTITGIAEQLTIRDTFSFD